MMEAAVGISVFLEDKASYDKAMAKFRTRTAAYVYLASDGELPKTVPSQNLNTREKIVQYWQGQSAFVNGLSQETCRDFTHTGYGLSAISHVAETSRIQGKDLYGTDVGERLRHGLGFHAKYQLGAAVPGLAVRRLAQARARAGHRGRSQRPGQPPRTRHDQHRDADHAGPPGRQPTTSSSPGRPSATATTPREPLTRRARQGSVKDGPGAAPGTHMS